jgi:hypothetical protein
MQVILLMLTILYVCILCEVGYSGFDFGIFWKSGEC